MIIGEIERQLESPDEETHREGGEGEGEREGRGEGRGEGEAGNEEEETRADEVKVV